MNTQEILTKYGAIPTDWRHCLQELEEYYNVEEQKRLTGLAMLQLFKYLVTNQVDMNWKKSLLDNINGRIDELNQQD